MDLPMVIQNLQSAIKSHQVTKEKINSFETWMKGKKFKEEYREEAEKVLQEAKNILVSGSGGSGYQQLQQQAQANRQFRRGEP